MKYNANAVPNISLEVVTIDGHPDSQYHSYDAQNQKQVQILEGRDEILRSVTGSILTFEQRVTLWMSDQEMNTFQPGPKY